MEYENMSLWTRPGNYAGTDWSGWYSAGFGKSRDSDALERANFDATLAALGGESETVVVAHEGHWAVGWVEWIAIDPSDTDALATADRIKRRYADYPVVSEELYSEYEDSDCAETWANCYNERERMDYLRRHLVRQRGESYAAGFREIRAAVRGDWCAAAQILPCPSDLIH
jgi:hypothetical protein